MPTKIQWTDEVWNVVTGCDKVSAGCRFCYAETIAKRFWGDRKFTDVKFHEDRLFQPAKWKKPKMIFVNSISDLFHESISNNTIERIFNQMMHNHRHIFQILTKRPERMKCFFKGEIKENIKKFLPNVWPGVSVEDQKTADERILLLSQTPAAVRWISAEPLLGEIDITPYLIKKKYFVNIKENVGLDWVVVGGESGHNARPMHPDWVRSIRDQCQAADVPFFFKQWGTWLPITQVEDCNYPIYASKSKIFDGETYFKLGKKKAGNLLDGKQYLEYPNAAI